MNHTSRVIILSGHSSDFGCPEWLDGHLHAVISKAEAFQALEAELDDLHACYEKDSDRTLRDAEAETRFTPREAEVFSLIGAGMTRRAVAYHQAFYRAADG